MRLECRSWGWHPGAIDRERCVIATFIKTFSKQGSVLDVACGYGRNLVWLVSQGYDVLGVDLNQEAVKANVARGLPSVTLQDFYSKPRGPFDVILMSHIIEHFLPDSLLPMMEQYLNLLKPGGALVIATPLPSNYFYEDFTHVRPYHPESIMMVFGEEKAQVSLRSPIRLKLKKIWFRRSPWKIRNAAACYKTRTIVSLRNWLDILFVGLFVASFGMLGRKDGWVGLFERT